jgi:hypothetical protein
MAGSTQILEVREFHDMLARWMILHPTATLKETAEHFKVSIGWVSIVKNSDAFKVHYRKLTDATFADALEEIQGQTIELASNTLAILNDKVRKDGKAFSPAELLQVADTALKRLGYGLGPRAPSGGVKVNIQNNNGGSSTTVVSAGELADARQKMAEVHGVRIAGHAAPGVANGAPQLSRSASVEDTESEVIDVTSVEV